MNEVIAMIKRIACIVFVVAALLFAGCMDLPGVPKIQERTTTTYETPEVVEEEEPIIEEESEETTTSSTTTTTTSTVTTSTTSTTVSSGGDQTCTLSSDCGEPYFSGCRCDANDVVRTMYKPMCVSGLCKWRTVDERTDCKKMTDLEGDEADESERCIPGYSRCITKEEADEYFTVPSEGDQIEDIDSSSFSEKYKDYSFKLKEAVETDSSHCLDSVYFTMYVLKPDGVLDESELAWNQTGEAGRMEFGLLNARRITGRGYVLDIWVREIF